MPKKTKQVTKTTRSKRQSAQHPKHFLKVYWPYIPIILMVSFGMFFGNANPVRQYGSSPATLAYSTEMSASALLSATNTQRASNGLGSLKLNSKLNASAQAKANDMVARDYWAHNTPDGDEPWVFIDAAGYSYKKAGENLAYGFSTSDATVIGWMNSPSHRANILDTSYTEVGFGFLNAENFTGTGQETVVVAHYGEPLTAAAPAPAPAPTPAPASATKPATSPSTPAPAPTPAPVTEEVVVPEPEITAEEAKPTETNKDSPTNTETAVTDTESKNITRLQWLTGGKAPWSALAISVVSFAVVIIWLIKHAVLVKRFVLQGEHFVAHHPLIDIAVVTVAAIAVYLSQFAGVVL